MINLTCHEAKITPVLQYALDELNLFLSQTKVKVELEMRLTVDKTLPEYESLISQNNHVITISAARASDVLWGVYRFLDKVGFYFDVHGCKVIPREIEESVLTQCCGNYIPNVLKRGIRQHINFPMDISSYPLEEALEYIRNLARCGFNHITFHSYPEQWYEYTYEGKTTYAGKFFYGEPHPVPQDTIITPYIRNKVQYMIPEMEEHVQNEVELSELAIGWLQEVMKQAKQCGMTIQFSFEPREASAMETLAIMEQIIQSYPLIDAIEMITVECGGFQGGAYTAEEVEGKIAHLFGEEVAIQCKPYVRDHLSQLSGPMEELARNLQVIQLAKEEGISPKMSLGLYISELDSLNICLQIMKAYAPQDVDFACLPAHGASAVAENLEGMQLTAGDLERTMPYSWIEFDGSMYEQQSAIGGLYQCFIALDRKMGGSAKIPALAANHWRTAENIVTMNYFAYACNYEFDKNTFFEYYCNKYHMVNTDKVRTAFELLEGAAETIRYHLGNSGFCYLGCWFNSGLGLIGEWQFPNINKALYQYNQALLNFKQLGELQCEDIALTINRIECSILHLTALKELMELQVYCKGREVEEITVEDKEQIERICTNASFYINEYMKRHCEMMPDRGCEGTIISYEHTLNGVIAYIRNKYLGETKAMNQVGNDAPPSPDIL